MALFKIEKGLSNNLSKARPNTNEGWCYFTTDTGKMYIDIKTGIETGDNKEYRVALNAATADQALKLTTNNVGSSTVPVYFDGGIPVQCGDTLDVNISGSAPIWTNERNFTISDNDVANVGLPSAVNGSNDINIKLPTTIKANLTGKADEAGNADTADQLNSDDGSSSVPVYFDGGIPVACTSLSLNTTGSSAKWTSPIEFTISSSDGSNTGAVSQVDGSQNIDIKLPSTITATLTGNADTATVAETAKQLNIAREGSVSKPVYFDGGLPLECDDTLEVNVTGNAATASAWEYSRTFKIADSTETNSGDPEDVDGNENIVLKLPEKIKATLDGTATLAQQLTTSDVGAEDSPVYFDGGIPTPCGDHLSVNVDSADTADKLSLTKDVGSTNVPVYFSATTGLPEPCTSLSLSTSGNAASATKASRLDDIDAGDINTPVYFVDGIPVACTSLDLNTSGTAATAISANRLSIGTVGNVDTPVYFEDGIPKTCTSDKYLPLSAGADKALTGPLGLPETIMYGIELPSDGFKGQLFFLADSAEENDELLFYVPEGGEEGESLVKNSNSDGDYSWKKISAFPKILTAFYDTSNTSVSRYTVTGDEPLKDGLTIAIKLNATSTAATSSFVLDYNNSGNKKIYDNRGLDLTHYRARVNYVLLLTYSLANNCWYSVANPESQWPITYSHTTANENCYLMGYKADSATSTYGINTVHRNQNVYMNPSTGSIYASKVYGAVWNDYAEYRAQKEDIKPGYCVASLDNGQVYKTTEKLQACDGIVSDTFGFSIGEMDGYETPLAVAGRVLAYYHGNKSDYHAGDTVCAGPEGKICKMTREEIREWPDRIVGIVSEIPEYEIWGTGNVTVNNRIWIKVK